MLDETSITDPIKDAYGNRVMMDDALLTELDMAVQCNMAEWLVEAAHHAVCNGDLLYLIRTIEKNTGWKRP